MAYIEEGRVWIGYLSNVSNTINHFAVLNQTCEDTIKRMSEIDAIVLDAI